MTLHIYTADWQRATRYRVPDMDHVFTTKPHAPIWVDCCKRRRIAKNVELQVYYDMTRARCRKGTGCKLEPMR